MGILDRLRGRSTILSLDDIKMRIINRKEFSEEEELDLSKDKEAINPKVCGIGIYNRHTGLFTHLKDYSIWGSIEDKKLLKDSVLIVFYNQRLKIDFGCGGCFRYDLKTGSVTTLFIPNEVVQIDVKTDIYSIGRFPSTEDQHRIIKSDNTVLCLRNHALGEEGYGDLIKLNVLFSLSENDKSPKYTFLEYKESPEDEEWKILSLKSKRDFEALLSSVPNDALMEALNKRLTVLMKTTDFKFLGYV